LEASSGQPHQRRRPPLLQAARQRRRPPLHQRLASGGGHLCTNGSPAAAATSAPVACRRWRPPQCVRRGPRPRPPMGVRTRPSKNVVVTSMAYNVLYDPRATSERRGRRRRGRHGCGGPAHSTTVARAVDRQPRPAWRQKAALEAAPKPSKPKRWSCSTTRFPPQRVGAHGMEPWLSPLSTFTRLVIILPPECWRKKREGASPPRTSRGGRRRRQPEG
jgi:hypothetical protein